SDSDAGADSDTATATDVRAETVEPAQEGSVLVEQPPEVPFDASMMAEVATQTPQAEVPTVAAAEEVIDASEVEDVTISAEAIASAVAEVTTEAEKVAAPEGVPSAAEDVSTTETAPRSSIDLSIDLPDETRHDDEPVVLQLRGGGTSIS